MIGRRRSFFAPMIGIVALFAALGPAVGGALFIPISAIFQPPGVGALAVFGLMGELFGRAAGRIFVYAAGLGPASATGLLHALWDAAAPERAPRALVAAAFGGLVASGAIAGLVCAFVANLIGLTMRPQFAPAVPAPAPSEAP